MYIHTLLNILLIMFCVLPTTVLGLYLDISLNFIKVTKFSLQGQRFRSSRFGRDNPGFSSAVQVTWEYITIWRKNKLRNWQKRWNQPSSCINSAATVSAPQNAGAPQNACFGFWCYNNFPLIWMSCSLFPNCNQVMCQLTHLLFSEISLHFTFFEAIQNINEKNKMLFFYLLRYRIFIFIDKSYKVGCFWFIWVSSFTHFLQN